MFVQNIPTKIISEYVWIKIVVRISSFVTNVFIPNMEHMFRTR